MVYVRDYLGDQQVIRPERDLARPVVSVILPTWRRYATGTLQRALDTVLDQSFRDLELIVVDDGSTDGTWDYLRERQARDPRVVLIRHERNSGLPAIRVNEGIELSRGRYVAFQFDDDEWLDGALECLVTRAESLSEPAVVYGDGIHVFPDGKVRRYPGVEVNFVFLFRQNRILNNSVLIPRALLEESGLYDCHLGMRRICDWDLWLRMSREVPFVPVGRILTRAHWRVDANAIDVIARYDLPLVRFLMSLPRNALLSPRSWRDYEVDGSSVAGVDIPRGLRSRFVAEQVQPYHERWGPAGAVDPRPADPSIGTPQGARTLACVLDGCYPSTDLLFGHYDPPTRARRTYVRFEQLIDQLEATWPTETDLLLMVRTVTAPTPEVARRAVGAGVPCAEKPVHDHLHIHEYGASFDHLAPGQPYHTNLVSALEQVDAVWATSRFIAESVRPHNPRIVPHNNALPEAWLPSRLRPRGGRGKIRIGHAGGGYRLEEFQVIWEGLRRIGLEFSEIVEFEFWGVDVGGLPPLEAPWTQRPFTVSYQAFMKRLRGEGFDIFLAPLLGRPRARLAKSPCKYYEVAAAGAFGIFSDVPPYEALPHGLTCLKVANTPEAWYEALCEAIRMPQDRFDAMRRRLIEHVRLEFTETAQIDLHEAACRATEVHRHTRGRRHPDGRPRVLLLGDSDRGPAPELLHLLRRYSIEPVVGPASDDPMAVAELEGLVARERPALALERDERSEVGKMFRARGIPAVSGMPAAVVPQDRFAKGLLRILRDVALKDGGRQQPVVAMREGLVEVTGLQRVSHLEASGIRWLDSGETTDLSGVDFLVAPAREQALLARAAAEGVLIVCVGAPRGPLPVDGVSGIVCPDSSAEAVTKGVRRALDLTSEARLDLRTAGYRAARGQVHPDAVANDLLRRFNDVLEKAASETVRAAPPPPPPVVAAADSPVPKPSTRARLKNALGRVGLYRPLSRLSWEVRRKRVLVVYEHLFASEHLYYGQVLEGLERQARRRWMFLPAAEVDPAFLYSYHTVISMRGTSEKSLEILQTARRHGCRTIYDTDDNLLLLDQAISDPANEWRRKYDSARPNIEAMLALADAVKVYSEAAASVFRRHNPNVVAIRPGQLVTRSELLPRGREGPVTVGFLGSSYKDEEFASLLPALRKLLDEGRPLRFEFFGFVPRELAARPGIMVHPWERDYRKYREKLDGLGWDIGLAPLRDTEFNQCKTNARYCEYAASGIAGIYSDARVYRDRVIHRQTGLLVPHGNTRAWYEAILELSTDGDLRNRIATRAFEDVRANYRREDYVRRVADLVESLRPRRG